MRDNQPTEQWQIESSMPYVDTYKSLTTVIPGYATESLGKMPCGKTQSNYAEFVRNEFEKTLRQHVAFCKDNHLAGKKLSDMDVTIGLIENLSPNTTFHLANSTSVRWTQLFPARADLTYICNRGTSGIDGSMSTAVGYAYASKQKTVFLTGDLSFIYDSNALWNNYVKANLKIIVMNNNGGNIFRFIGDKELMKNSLDFFTTPHQVKIASLVKAYGLEYISCTETNQLAEAMVKLLTSDKATVLEVFTDSDLNTENYKEYFKNIKI